MLKIYLDKKSANLARQRNVDIAIDCRWLYKISQNRNLCQSCSACTGQLYRLSGQKGAEFMDYIVADRILIPESHERFYQEKIVSLPGTFQPD
jgi:hypothetical protein